MLILLDECVPRPLKRSLTGHTVRTVPDMGWSGQRNSQLLQSCDAEQVDVLVTVDRSMAKQQNLKNFRVSVVLLKAKSNTVDDLVLLVPQLIAALLKIQPGQYIEI